MRRPAVTTGYLTAAGAQVTRGDAERRIANLLSTTNVARGPFQLCYITDRRALSPKPLAPRILEACRAGIDLIQIREKDLPVRDLLEIVRGAVEGSRGTGTRVIVNDRLDVALALGAGGVHVGTQSIPVPAVVEAVRGRGPSLAEFLIGVSCHSLDETLLAEQAGANYVLLGPIFETPSKLAYGPPLGIGKLREVAARVRVPVLALGGISVERIRACLDAGARGIAGISLFQACDSIEERMREITQVARASRP